MKRFLIGLVTGIVLSVLIGFIFVASLARLGNQKPAIEENSTLLLKMEGDVPEKAPAEIPLPFFEGQTPITVLEYYQTLRRAAADPKIKAVILMPHRVGAGWAKMQELRQDLLNFKKSGKPLYAYLRNPGTREYYLATAADQIYMTHEDVLDVKGLRLEMVFVKNTLDKIGAQVEIEHAGKYKDAGDMFTRTSLTPESREALDAVLNGLYDDMVRVIAESRHQSVDQVKAKIDNGPFLAKEAVANGLIDKLLYEDEMLGEVRKKLGQTELKKLAVRTYVKAAPPLGTAKRIALLTGDGAITRGDDNDNGRDESGITAMGFVKLLRRVGEDKNISGVILRVDSPGGDAIASDDILREVKLLSQKKPMVISMSDVAASGGYYISVTGDPILAYPNTLTGSIGVIFGKLYLHGLYDKLGIQKEILKRGQDADIDTDYQPLSDRARAKLRQGIDATYQTFLQRVADGRRKPVSAIEPVAQGRVWIGSDARGNGLVDELGGLDKAIEMVKAKAKLSANETVQLIAYPPKRSIFDQLFSRTNDNSVEAKVQNYLGLRGFDLKLWTHGGIMQLMPYTINVR